uniref:Spliceosome-associated protein CWC27 homolog n=1 Tax=Arion vulgaris TaxID=1028688 RepID=A0A0B7AA45_9EUPU
MSNIYIQEPPTKGKVLLVTSVGDIDIELWSKEAPKACRNFVQLCMEEYYDGTIFHRVVKDFIVQGGDPTGTGTGGESIYGSPFKDEFHSRLRFVRRGLVAMANAGPHDNGSQFFFTMNQTPELQNKHTIFGKVTGVTLYNILKLQEVDVDVNERPLFPHKIIRTEILFNPFDDIIPRVIKKVKKEEDKKIKSKSKATKNFSLLSFGEEAEEDEEQTFKASKKFSGKSKSSHDLTDDPNLSSVPVVENSDIEKTSSKRKAPDDMASIGDLVTEDVRKKLKKDDSSSSSQREVHEQPALDDDTKKSKSEEIKKEVKKLQKEIKDSKKELLRLKPRSHNP